MYKLRYLFQIAAQIIETWQANISTGNTPTATKQPAQHGKRSRLLSYNSPATSDLFDPYFNDEICEEKLTDSLMSCRVSSPETNGLFEATVSEDGDLSPNTSKVFM